MNADKIVNDMAERIVSRYCPGADFHTRLVELSVMAVALQPVRALLIAAEEAGSTCKAIRRVFEQDRRPVLTGLCADAETLVVAALADMERCGEAVFTSLATDPETLTTADSRQAFLADVRDGTSPLG